MVKMKATEFLVNQVVYDLAKETLKANLTENENHIVEARKTGKAFWEIDEEFVRAEVDAIFFKASAITGAALPETEIFAKYLAEEFLVLLKERNFDVFTPAEISLAMRLNTILGLSHNGYELVRAKPGKRINTAYFSQCLQNYRNLRGAVDRKFETIINKF